MAERMWDYYEGTSNTSVSLEVKNWNERSKDSKLNAILHKLNDEEKKKPNSDKSKKIQKLQNLLIKWEYIQFQKEIWMTNCNWKLWEESFEMLKNFLEKLNQIETSQQSTSQELSNLWISIKKPEQITHGNDTITSPETTSNHVDNLKINRAAKKYLSKYESLPKSMYDLMFSWKEEMWQWQLWNCYLISWLIELANTQYFDTLMRTSISRVKFKDDWAFWFSIKIPLWEPNGRDILIKDSELMLARVKWNIGYKLLELTYVKSRRTNNKAWNTYYPVTNAEIEQSAWWSMTDVLQKFLWRHNIGFSDFWSLETDYKWLPLSSLPESRKREITNYLKNFNGTIWNNFTNLGTPLSPHWDRSSFEVWWNTLYNWHVYALSSVDKNLNVYVKNPRNNEKKAWGSEVKLSLDEFFNSFSFIRVGKIKVDTFLDDKWVSYA